MPPGAFPMSKGKKNSYRLGAAYRWRIIKFDALTHSFRLLVAYRTDVDEFRAMLGMVVGSDTRLVCEHCFHGSHPGWHVHADCGHIENNPVGVMRWPGYTRRPKSRSAHRSLQLVRGGGKLNEGYALQIAEQRFQLYSEGELLGVRLKRPAP